jgi:starch phosphorylase
MLAFVRADTSTVHTETVATEALIPPDESGLGVSARKLREDFEFHLRKTLAKDRYTATDRDRYFALALSVRDRLVDQWIGTQQAHHSKNVKRIYYLSLEFLIGRLLGNNVINLNLEDSCRSAMGARSRLGRSSGM